jgi:hypothetical protein
MKLSPTLLAHFANNYLEFIALVQAGVISRSVADQWCSEIWSFVYTTYYSQASKAA